MYPNCLMASRKGGTSFIPSDSSGDSSAVWGTESGESSDMSAFPQCGQERKSSGISLPQLLQDAIFVSYAKTSRHDRPIKSIYWGWYPLPKSAYFLQNRNLHVTAELTRSGSAKLCRCRVKWPVRRFFCLCLLSDFWKTVCLLSLCQKFETNSRHLLIHGSLFPLFIHGAVAPPYWGQPTSVIPSFFNVSGVGIPFWS